MADIMLKGHKCERCGHRWVPRDWKEKPRVCPKRMNPYWNEPPNSGDTAKRRTKLGQNSP